MGLSVDSGGQEEGFAELAGESTLVGEAAIAGDLGQGVGGAAEEFGAAFQAALHNILFGG